MHLQAARSLWRCSVRSAPEVLLRQCSAWRVGIAGITAPDNGGGEPDSGTGRRENPWYRRRAHEEPRDVVGRFEVLLQRAGSPRTNSEQLAKRGRSIESGRYSSGRIAALWVSEGAATGFDMMETKLGMTETVELAEYRGYVADETKSCFVDGIDLYYSCPMTEQGIVLVDTPGADSFMPGTPA